MKGVDIMKNRKEGFGRGKDVNDNASVGGTGKKIDETRSRGERLNSERVRLNEAGEQLKGSENYREYKRQSNALGNALARFETNYGQLEQSFKKRGAELPEIIDGYREIYGRLSKEHEDSMIKNLANRDGVAGDDMSLVRLYVFQGSRVRDISKVIKENYSDLERSIVGHNEEVNKHNKGTSFYKADKVELSKDIESRAFGMELDRLTKLDMLRGDVENEDT